MGQVLSYFGGKLFLSRHRAFLYRRPVELVHEPHKPGLKSDVGIQAVVIDRRLRAHDAAAPGV